MSDPLTPDDPERIRATLEEWQRDIRENPPSPFDSDVVAKIVADAVRLLDEVERLEKWVQRAVWIYKDVHDDPDWNAWSLITEMAESAKVVN